MGEYADMFLDGTLDSVTGELIDGHSPGHPRRKKATKPDGAKCPHCERRFKNAHGMADHINAKHADRCADEPVLPLSIAIDAAMRCLSTHEGETVRRELRRAAGVE